MNDRSDLSDSHATTQPLVSVFVISFNQSAFVLETLDSVLSQTYENIQLVILDDCSQDNSRDIIKNWIDEHRVKCDFVVHTQNQGICRTLNEALSIARGKYISMTASDDTWFPEKLEREVALMEAASEDIGVVYSDACLADVSGRRLDGMFIARHREFTSPPEGDIFDVLVHGNFIPAHSALIRRKCFDVVGPYDERLKYEDWDMWLRIAAHFKYAFMPWPCGVYRVVPTSLMHQLNGPERRNEIATNNFIILEKCLAAPRTTPALRQKVATDLGRLAETMYALNGARRLSFLWRALRASWNRRLALMCLMCMVGLPYSAFMAFDAAHSSWRRRAVI
jgi:glycosyltransferase involved in cell wall biosynthesis